LELLLIGLLPYSGLLRCMPFHVLSQFRRPPFEDLQCVACLRRFLQFSLRRAACSGCFSRTRRKCNFTVVKTPLYCTRKWSYNLSCTSALSLLQLPCNGSTGQVPLTEHEVFWRNTWYMNQVFLQKFRVPRGGPAQLNRCKEAAAGSMLTCSSNCSFISWYNTMGGLLPWSCTSVAFWKNSHM